MRGSIRKGWVVGTLASALLLFPGCADTNRGMDTQEQMGTGGTGGAGLEDQDVVVPDQDVTGGADERGGLPTK